MREEDRAKRAGTAAWNTGGLPRLVESKEKRAKEKFAGSTRGITNDKKHSEKIISLYPYALL